MCVLPTSMYAVNFTVDQSDHCMSIYTPCLQLCHRLKAGEVLTVNNRRILHSRCGFKLNGGVRHLQVEWLLNIIYWGIHSRQEVMLTGYKTWIKDISIDLLLNLRIPIFLLLLAYSYMYTCQNCTHIQPLAPIYLVADSFANSLL